MKEEHIETPKWGLPKWGLPFHMENREKLAASLLIRGTGSQHDGFSNVGSGKTAEQTVCLSDWWLAGYLI